MNQKQLEELGVDFSAHIIKLGRAPTPLEVSKYIKGWITARQKGKLFGP